MSTDLDDSHKSYIWPSDTRQFTDPRQNDMPDIYGDVELQKEECINHVAKRLGTALRKLASSGKKHGVTLGGRGHGKLNQATILKLTAYYGKAVRANSNNLDAMRDAVLATFDHATSTDERPHHDRCPVGADSWCFYQKSLAPGEVPGPHRDLVGTPLSADVAKQVEGVYLCLSHDDLLRRCLRGVTQNANESLHSKVWAKCPKTGFYSASTELCPPHVPRLPNSTAEWRPRCDTCAV